MTTSQTPNMTDYEAERRSFQLDVPEYFNFAADIIDKQAQNSDKEAMLWIGQHGEERHITFTHFSNASSRAANAADHPGIAEIEQDQLEELPGDPLAPGQVRNADWLWLSMSGQGKQGLEGVFGFLGEHCAGGVVAEMYGWRVI